ncbi:FMN-binding protein [Anaerosacchariphilus polymeriproducens]|uniref:FMN-binding protein n=2 Tax=Anaerosacchariphilus polymeriproducens TaxID=1812858 RepID=A0A371AZV8_9FIRM|nr:FMN-binding protein [Anaerosacchariphilus polymeriproducens]
MVGWSIAIVFIAVLGIGGTIGWSKVSREHIEAKSLPLDGVDFNKLSDGTYIGEYEGGMYKWRTNKVQVTVASGKVTDIKLISSKELSENNTYHIDLYNRVLEEQTLKVDTISGATLTSKAYLQGIENALKQAQK